MAVSFCAGDERKQLSHIQRLDRFQQLTVEKTMPDGCASQAQIASSRRKPAMKQ